MRQRHVARLRSVIARGDVDLPEVGIGRGSAHADLAEAGVFRGIGQQQHAQILGRRGRAGSRSAVRPGSDENDLAGAAAGLAWICRANANA